MINRLEELRRLLENEDDQTQDKVATILADYKQAAVVDSADLTTGKTCLEYLYEQHRCLAISTDVFIALAAILLEHGVKEDFPNDVSFLEMLIEKEVSPDVIIILCNTYPRFIHNTIEQDETIMTAIARRIVTEKSPEHLSYLCQLLKAFDSRYPESSYHSQRLDDKLSYSGSFVDFLISQLSVHSDLSIVNLITDLILVSNPNSRSNLISNNLGALLIRNFQQQVISYHQFKSIMMKFFEHGERWYFIKQVVDVYRNSSDFKDNLFYIVLTQKDTTKEEYKFLEAKCSLFLRDRNQQGVGLAQYLLTKVADNQLLAARIEWISPGRMQCTPDPSNDVNTNNPNVTQTLPEEQESDDGFDVRRTPSLDQAIDRQLLSSAEKKLVDAVQAMRDYGAHLKHKAGSSKGDVVITLADALNKKLHLFLDQSAQEKQAGMAKFEKEFTVILNSKNDDLKAYRVNWQTILANIVIALTGVGLVLIAAHLLYSYATTKDNRALFFFQKPTTTSEDKQLEVVHALAALGA